MAARRKPIFSKAVRLARFKALSERFGERVAKRFANRRTVAAGGKVFSARVDPKIQAKAFVARTRATDFYSALQSFPEIAIGNVASVIEEVGARTLASVQDKTAVLSGEARDSWQLDYYANGLGFQVASNWPGIRRLEHGWSKQRGKGGMVRITTKLIRGYIQTAAARLSGAAK